MKVLNTTSLFRSSILNGKSRNATSASPNWHKPFFSSKVNEIPLEAQFKNPIVAKLWAARQEAKQRLTLSDTGSTNSTDVSRAAAAVVHEGRPVVGEEMRGRHPSESATEITYPFSNDLILREAYQSPWGEMRIGKVRVKCEYHFLQVPHHHSLHSGSMISCPSSAPG